MNLTAESPNELYATAFQTNADLFRWARRERDFSELLIRLSGWLNANSENLGLWLYHLPSNKLKAINDAGKTSFPIVEETLLGLCEGSGGNRGGKSSFQSVISERLPNKQLVAVPIRIGNEPQYVLAGFFETGRYAKTHNEQLVIDAATSVEIWGETQEHNSIKQVCAASRRCNDFLLACCSLKNAEDIWGYLVDWLQNQTQAQQVVILKPANR